MGEFVNNSDMSSTCLISVDARNRYLLTIFIFETLRNKLIHMRNFIFMKSDERIKGVKTADFDEKKITFLWV